MPLGQEHIEALRQARAEAELQIAEYRGLVAGIQQCIRTFERTFESLLSVDGLHAEFAEGLDRLYERRANENPEVKAERTMAPVDVRQAVDDTVSDQFPSQDGYTLRDFHDGDPALFEPSDDDPVVKADIDPGIAQYVDDTVSEEFPESKTQGGLVSADGLSPDTPLPYSTPEDLDALAERAIGPSESEMNPPSKMGGSVDLGVGSRSSYIAGSRSYPEAPSNDVLDQDDLDDPALVEERAKEIAHSDDSKAETDLEARSWGTGLVDQTRIPGPAGAAQRKAGIEARLQRAGGGEVVKHLLSDKEWHERLESGEGEPIDLEQVEAELRAGEDDEREEAVEEEELEERRTRIKKGLGLDGPVSVVSQKDS